MRPIFRQQAWEHFSSPEQLDQLLQVVSPQRWLALATCGALVGVALLWGIFGRLPTTVMGQGVLIHPRQVVDVQAPAAGRLATLAVRVGDVIHIGDVLGTIEQTEMRYSENACDKSALFGRWSGKDFLVSPYPLPSGIFRTVIDFIENLASRYDLAIVDKGIEFCPKAWKVTAVIVSKKRQQRGSVKNIDHPCPLKAYSSKALRLRGLMSRYSAS